MLKMILKIGMNKHYEWALCSTPGQTCEDEDEDEDEDWDEDEDQKRMKKVMTEMSSEFKETWVWSTFRVHSRRSLPFSIIDLKNYLW